MQRVGSMSQIEPWKELSREVTFKKYSRKLESVDFRLPNGTVSDFIIDARRPAACVLGITPDNQVILVKQFRPGPQMILDELPGGFIESNEDPLAAASREFQEETGYTGDVEFIGTCLDDAYSTMERYCYVARNCVKVSEPEETDTEKTEVILISLTEFRSRLRQGKMTDVEVGYLGLDYLHLL